MAISKERLEELIDKGATIWYVGKDYSVNANRMVEIRLGKFNKIENDYLLVKIGDGFHTPRYNFVAYLDELFETKKQAEWSLKYHATRTEELNLPMWEEFCRNVENDCELITFSDSHYNNYEMFVDGRTSNKDILIAKYPNGQYIFCEPATEEIYTKACDLCLKLFEEEK